MELSSLEKISNQDGTSNWNGKFIQMTERGDMIVSVGSGTAVPSTTKGIIEITGEGEMRTQSLKLTNLNGAKWTCERKHSVIYVELE